MAAADRAGKQLALALGTGTVALAPGWRDSISGANNDVDFYGIRARHDVWYPRLDKDGTGRQDRW